MKFANFLRMPSLYRTPLMVASESNAQEQLSEGFSNDFYKIVSPVLLQELINHFAICKICNTFIY